MGLEALDVVSQADDMEEAALWHRLLRQSCLYGAGDNFYGPNVYRVNDKIL